MKRYAVTGEWAGSRLDRFARALLPGLSFGSVQTLLRRKRILLNGAAAAGRTRIGIGDAVEVDARLGPAPGCAPPDAGIPPGGRLTVSAAGARPEKDRLQGKKPIRGIPEAFDILYEDDDLLVIDKPSGMVVQPGNRAELGSLLDSLEDYRKVRESGQEDSPAPFPWTPVHRLDRETSGALAVAKNRRSARFLSEAFSRGKILKLYLAVVEGVPGRRTGKISAPVSTEKGKKSVTRRDRRGKRAESRYRVLRKVPGGKALLEVKISTGRTHQIRVHLASIGHPVSGDRQYGTGRRKAGERLMLHSWKITIPRPGGGAVEAVAPPPGGLKP